MKSKKESFYNVLMSEENGMIEERRKQKSLAAAPSEF